MRKHFKKYFPIISVLILAGCAVWTDFTTFFNLYFNTRELYYEVQEDIAVLSKESFQLKEPEISSNIKTKLITLQEKTSKILQHESESSYFDDALFMSGWAFYFNRDYIKATRKFQELASLRNEEYDLISKMWIGKCALQMRDFEKGMDILTEVRDSSIAREDDDVLSDVYVVIISYHIDREEYETAISEGEKLIAVSDNDELNAKVAYQIGLLYLETGQDKQAATAFESVLDYSPDFETEFSSKFELAKLKKELGLLDESLEMFDDLYNEGKYSAFWGDVYFQIGMIEYEAQNYEKAFDVFTDVNELYSSSKGALESQLMLGEIMRNVYADYDSAKVYYDKVKGNNVDPELKEKAEVYSESITAYVNLKTDISTSDRQITYILEPTEFIRDSLAYERFLISTGIVKNDPNISDTTNIDSTNTVIGDTTIVADTTVFTSARDSLLAQSNIDFSSFDDDYILEVKPVYPRIGVDSLEAKIAKGFFDLGNLFFTDLIRPDSAYYYYTALLIEFPETKYKPRALFALGTYYQTKGDKATSDSLFLQVYEDFKTHPIASEAAKKIGKPPLITESDPAQIEYLKAEAKLDSSNYNSALNALKNIALDYPESIYKPKSLYTIGWIYENNTSQPDSAANYYSKIVEEYPNSEYASAVKKKVSNYSAELKRIEMELQKVEVNADSTQLADSTLSADSTRGNIIPGNELEQNNPQLSEKEQADSSGHEGLLPSVTNPEQVDTTESKLKLNNDQQQTTPQTTKPEEPDTTNTKLKLNNNQEKIVPQISEPGIVDTTQTDTTQTK